MNNGIFDSGPWTQARVQVIEVSQRVPLLAGATHVSFLLLGGGGGGGSGRLDTALGTANGGAGGSGGGLQYRRRMPLRLFNLLNMESFSVTIGAGGTVVAAIPPTPTNNGIAGGAGGSSRMDFTTNFKGPIQTAAHGMRLNVTGGGAGAGGTTGIVNATATANSSGQINGITGGQGTTLQSIGGHSTNSFGTNPFHWIAVSGGCGGNSAGQNAANWNLNLQTFNNASLSAPALTGNETAPDCALRNKPIWDFMLANWKEAPVMEELAWLTVHGGANGNSGSSGSGGGGGKGFRGTGGGGGAGAHYTSSGAGGAGGNGVCVLWWERLV